MGSARLVFGFGGHGQRRQRREGGGEQPPQLQGTEGVFTDLLSLTTLSMAPKAKNEMCRAHHRPSKLTQT